MLVLTNSTVVKNLLSQKIFSVVYYIPIKYEYIRLILEHVRFPEALRVENVYKYKRVIKQEYFYE